MIIVLVETARPTMTENGIKLTKLIKPIKLTKLNNLIKLKNKLPLCAIHHHCVTPPFA